MCWKKKPPEPIEKVEHRILTFGRNKYGGGNDLNGCVPDSKGLSKDVAVISPNIDIRMFLDYEATAKNYLDYSRRSIALLEPGATVFIPSDSCFSGGNTRGNPYKNRFLDPGLPFRENIRSHIFRGTNDINWITISACGENQTAADAWISGGYVGAFTYYLRQVMRKGMTYREMYEAVRKYLPSTEFTQIPTLEGPEELVNRKIFEGQTLWVHNSSHGSWTYDKNGDEADGRDEGIYLDRLIIDDETHEILKGIAA